MKIRSDRIADGQKVLLNQVGRARKAAKAHVERARIILLCAEGKSNYWIKKAKDLRMKKAFPKIEAAIARFLKISGSISILLELRELHTCLGPNVYFS